MSMNYYAVIHPSETCPHCGADGAEAVAVESEGESYTVDLPERATGVCFGTMPADRGEVYVHVRPKRIHLLKLSGGWVPGIHYQEDYYEDWQTFVEFIERPDVTIENEHRETVTTSELLSRIETHRGVNERHRDSQDWHPRVFFRDTGCDFMGGEWS